MNERSSSLRHLIGIKSLTREELLSFVNEAETFVEVSERSIKKVPALRGKTILNVFLEPSTRTRVSFEIAGKRLSADTINISGSGSSLSKGETLLDTARTLQAMRPDILVIRHGSSAAPQFLAERLRQTSIVNAGDGMNEHPTQCLLDLLALQCESGAPLEKLSGMTVAIVGDIRHSRVARSHIWAHRLLGNTVRLIGPPGLVPRELADEQCFGKHVEIHHHLESGLKGADFVIVLRVQKERQKESFISSFDEYSRFYGISSEKLQQWCPDAFLLHPGPANRGIEITGELLYATRSLVEKQVRYGVAVRMAVLFRFGSVRHHFEDDESEEASSADGIIGGEIEA
ncbi:aspartate carbamoyltransferase catalytic subunit [bacterium]|nr:aspartate carbamoyltransferase catalytic subunit [bacterium]